MKDAHNDAANAEGFIVSPLFAIAAIAASDEPLKASAALTALDVVQLGFERNDLPREHEDVGLQLEDGGLKLI